MAIAIQAALSVAMMVVGGIELNTIGDILGTGEVVTLGWFGYLITVKPEANFKRNDIVYHVCSF